MKKSPMNRGSNRLKGRSLGRRRFPGTKLMEAILQQRNTLNQMKIFSFLDLRKAVAANLLSGSGVGTKELKEFASFASLARIFPSNVALVLQEQGADGLSSLIRWKPDRFVKALAAGGIAKGQLAREQYRFMRLKALIKTGRSPKDLTGLQMDLGEDYTLLGPNAARLAEAGVETLSDWASLRGRIKADPEVQELLDGYARLSVLGFEPQVVKQLLRQKVDSAMILARQSNSALQHIAAQAGIQIKLLTAGIWLFNTEIEPVLPWPFPPFELPLPPCDDCPENESVFSKFAYYLYLVDKTEQTFFDLENTLFQDFSRLTHLDGEEVVSQVVICNEILQRALGRDLNQDESLPVLRYQVLSILRLAVPLSPAQIVSFASTVTTSLAADLLPRLIAAYAAPPPEEDEEMLNTQPLFTRAELMLLGQVGEMLLIQEVQADPAFSGATPDQLFQEVRQRIAARAQEAIDFTPLVRRAAFKKALNQTDRQLFDTFCIETDLAFCVQTTRLDQAIQTLQTYLTKNGAGGLAYISFESWRGEILGQKYPEAKLLLRDDVLVGDTGIWDRGSILLNHSAQLAELKSQLASVSRAIDNARVDQRARKVDKAIWDGLGKFQDEPYYANFRRGLAVIDNILEANDQIYRATSDMDHEEPSLALGRLQAAVSLLDQVDAELFENDWFWANQESSPKRYAELVKATPDQRKERLLQQFDMFAQSRKKLFEIEQINEPVAGLTGLEVLQVDHPDWTASPEFEQGSAYIVRNETNDVTKFSEFSYDDGRNLEDYTFSCEFRTTTRWRLGQPDGDPKVGIGFRLRDGTGGYRLSVLSDTRVSDDDGGGGRTVQIDVLALQKISPVDSEILDEAVIGSQDYTEIEGSWIETNHWYGLTVTASGARLTGSLRITPEETRSVGPVTDASFDKGTISIFVGGTAEVEFRSVSYRPLPLTGTPPFFARERADRPFDLQSDLSDDDYSQHLHNGQAMSLGLVADPLTSPIETYEKSQLFRIALGTLHLYLTFPPGGSAVDLSALDILLERCLMLTYYLRFAAIPVRMAQAYLALGEYRTAADLLHILYDEDANDEESRKIYPFLHTYVRGLPAAWGNDAAAMRLRLGEVYLRWAEMLFRQNTTNSRFEARQLYGRVLRLHWREGCDCFEEQQQASAHVIALARQARAPDGTYVAREVLRRNTFVPLDLVNKTKSWNDVQELIDRERKAHRAKVRAEGTPSKLEAKALVQIKAAELAAIGFRGMSTTALNTVHPLKVSGIRGIDGTAVTTIHHRIAGPLTATISSLARRSLCVPDNPLESAQVREACLMLDMLKNCVNILGYSDSLVPSLRFETLLRVAYNFADLAHAAERDLLQFRQAFEQEVFALMQAEAGFEQAEFEVVIDRMNVELAEGEITLAEIQQDQAEFSVRTFETLVSEGMTTTEENALAMADAAANIAVVSAVFNVAALPFQIIASVTAAGATGGASVGAGAGTGIGGTSNILGSLQNAFSASASALSMRASLERQQQDREFQLQQMKFAFSMALQSVSLAFQRWEMAQLQAELAVMKRDFAKDAFAFLNNKLLSAAGWLMLMKVAREQYRHRLSYAIEISFLAERALAFELQNPALKIIRFDYYDPRKDGLLGATQLLTDLGQMENRKLAFRKRKLQLSKTVSFASSFPAAFQQFRNGPGVFVFSLLPEMFDRDFPGHYLRLIQSIRVTVVALIPPRQGIHATLRNTGVSQVVVGPPYAPVFESRMIRRNPEAIALSATVEATGLFVFDYKDDLLLPFEGSGVVTDWIFEMPKATNLFNYENISDILVTIEYTALEGTSSYRAEVANRLGSDISAERAFSLRREFADQWHDLNNPELIADPAKQMVVSLETRRTDFPSNLDPLLIDHVSLFFAHDDGAPFSSVPVRYMNFANDGNRDRVDSDPLGVISTRRTSGAGAAPASWSAAMAGKDVVGIWELSFNFGDLVVQDPAIRQRFKEGEIKDILLVISYHGRRAA